MENPSPDALARETSLLNIEESIHYLGFDFVSTQSDFEDRCRYGITAEKVLLQEYSMDLEAMLEWMNSLIIDEDTFDKCSEAFYSLHGRICVELDWIEERLRDSREVAAWSGSNILLASPAHSLILPAPLVTPFSGTSDYCNPIIFDADSDFSSTQELVQHLASECVSPTSSDMSLTCEEEASPTLSAFIALDLAARD